MHVHPFPPPYSNLLSKISPCLPFAFGSKQKKTKSPKLRQVKDIWFPTCEMELRYSINFISLLPPSSPILFLAIALLLLYPPAILPVTTGLCTSYSHCLEHLLTSLLACLTLTYYSSALGLHQSPLLTPWSNPSINVLITMGNFSLSMV